MNSKVIKSGLWFTISNFLVKAIGFITTPIFTRLLTKSEFGLFNNFTTWVGIILVVTSLNLESSLIRARFEFEDDLECYLFSMISLSLVSTATWFFIYICFRSFFNSIFNMSTTVICAIFVYLFFYPAINLFQNTERFRYKYGWTVATSLVISFGSAILSVFLVLTLNNKLWGRIIGFISPVVAVGIVLIIYYGIRCKRIKIEYWKYALIISIPFIPHLLSMYLLGGLDKVMINSICGSEDLALYSLAYTVGSIVTLLINSMNNAFSPWLGEQLSKKNYSAIKSVSIKYIISFIFFAIGVVLFAPEVLFILGGQAYLEAIYVIPPVAGGCIMQFAYCMYVNVEQYEKKTIGMAGASILAALLNYVTNYFLIRQFGYIAAAYTTFVSYMVLLLMHMLLVKRIGKSNVYENKGIIISVLFASLVIFALSILLDKIIIRYIMIVIYCSLSVFLLLKIKQRFCFFKGGGK